MFKKLFSSINLKLLPMKAHYFLFNLATGPVIANLSTIARQKGFSASITGILLTALYLVAFTSKPIFGWIADYFKIHKIIFILCQATTAVCLFSVYFIPTFSNSVRVHSGPSGTEVYFCPKNSIWDKCFVERYDLYKSNVIKCSLSCKPEEWMFDEICSTSADIPKCLSNIKPFEYDMSIDVNKTTIDFNCLILKEFNIAENKSQSFFNLASDFFKKYEGKCEARCEDDYLKGFLANRGALSDEEITQKYEFWLLCSLLLIGYSTNSVVVSMADTICFDLLGNNAHNYGKQRMWDAIGWGVAALVVWPIIDIISGNSIFKDYTIVYFFCLVTVGINIIWSTGLKYSQPVKSKSIIKDIGKLFKSVKILIFFIWCCFGGFFSGVIWNFVFWHLEELTAAQEQTDCGGNYVKTLEGLDVAIQCIIGEIPFFLWAGYIIKKLGHINCMHLALGGFAVRFYYYSMLVNPWWVLPIEAFNGLTYGLLYSTMVSYANTIAPPGAEATLQGFIGALFEGIGIALGNLTAGTLFGIYGGGNSFLIFGIMASSAMVLHIIVHYIIQFKEKGKINK